MDNHHDNNPLDELGARFLAAYIVIDKILGELPIPIRIPSIERDDWNSRIGVAALERARAALRDLPLDSLAASILDKMILDWHTAHAIADLTELVGPQPHRLEAMAYALTRIGASVDLVQQRLRDTEN
ncbi:hypothetical protein AB0D67_38540 [Streptosporangium sp. NPDC048047]|uniref:hypothetical protein n=1 Tax=Streptosporangium sp. NPDC048047 TaxID=3155748 RepID=UPI00343240B7